MDTLERLGYIIQRRDVRRRRARATRANRVGDDLTGHARRVRFAGAVDVGHDDVRRQVEGRREVLGQRDRARDAMRLEDSRDAFVPGGSSRAEYRVDFAGQVRVTLVDVDATPRAQEFEAPRRTTKFAETGADRVG